VLTEDLLTQSLRRGKNAEREARRAKKQEKKEDKKSRRRQDRRAITDSNEGE
jgi:hypothetical protein